MNDHQPRVAADRLPGPPRLLAVGPGIDQSSYARVLHGTLGPLSASWDIRHLAINHRGQPVDRGWRILPNPEIGDRYGIGPVVEIARAFAPDAILVMNSFLTLPRYWNLPALLGPHRPLLVAHCPVLGEPTDPRLVGRLAFFDVVAVLSETVRRAFEGAFATCLREGWIDRVPELAVIPHGFDAATFHPLADRRAARQAIPQLRDLPGDAFVVLNANRNELRKRIDVTLEGFARFASGKPANVRLHLHMGETAGGEGLRDAAQRLGIAKRVTLATTEPRGHPSLDDATLNQLYNACDVGLNTASGEGWGMISIEHAATGAPQLVPAPWVCGEIWQGHAELLEATEQPAGKSATRETLVSADSVAAALERLYSDLTHRATMASRAVRLANREEYQWAAIARQWDTLLRWSGGRFGH